LRGEFKHSLEPRKFGLELEAKLPGQHVHQISSSSEEQILDQRGSNKHQDPGHEDVTKSYRHASCEVNVVTATLFVLAALPPFKARSCV
jgi:hypothetical protein